MQMRILRYGRGKDTELLQIRKGAVPLSASMLPLTIFFYHRHYYGRFFIICRGLIMRMLPVELTSIMFPFRPSTHPGKLYMSGKWNEGNLSRFFRAGSPLPKKSIYYPVYMSVSK